MMVQTKPQNFALANPSPLVNPRAPRSAPRDNSPEAVAARRSYARRLARAQRAEAVTIATSLACTALVGLLGVVWLAACARVTWEGRELNGGAQTLRLAQEHHEMLTQELTSLQSASRIKTLALRMKMVPGGASHYMSAALPARTVVRAPQRIADAR